MRIFTLFQKLENLSNPYETDIINNVNRAYGELLKSVYTRILLFLRTKVGSSQLDKNFGLPEKSRLHSLLFSQQSGGFFTKLARQLEKYEPRIHTVSINLQNQELDSDTQGHFILFTVKLYPIDEYQKFEQKSFEFSFVFDLIGNVYDNIKMK